MRWRAPTSPSIAIRSGKKRRDHSTGLPRLPSKVGTTTSAPRSGSKAAISRSISAASTCGMSPRQTTAPSASAGTAAMPALQRGAEPVGEIRIVDEPHRQAGERLLDLLALMAGHDDDGLGARGQRLLGGDADERPAARSRPAACSVRPCGSSVRRRARSRRCAGRRRSRLLARLRPRDDLHQQPADAHAGDGRRAAPRGRPAAASAPSRSRSPWASARSPARRAPAGRARRRPAADCRDRPACRNARCARRSPRPRPGSRRAGRRWPKRRTR